MGPYGTDRYGRASFHVRRQERVPNRQSGIPKKTFYTMTPE